MRDMAELRGAYLDVTRKCFYDGTEYPEDYVRITLTDEEDIPDAAAKLRLIYSNLMLLDYDNSRTRNHAVVGGAADVEKKTPLELFAELYRLQNGAELSPVQEEYLNGLIEEIWEERK